MNYVSEKIKCFTVSESTYYLKIKMYLFRSQYVTIENSLSQIVLAIVFS